MEIERSDRPQEYTPDRHGILSRRVQGGLFTARAFDFELGSLVFADATMLMDIATRRRANNLRNQEEPSLGETKHDNLASFYKNLHTDAPNPNGQ